MLENNLSIDVAELTQWRREIHSHPETAFEEHKTSAKIVSILKSFAGVEVYDGLAGGTGVVAVIKGSRGGDRAIGLRADIDALDVCEANDLPYASGIDSKMHACGHDGHTTMLLGAARALASKNDFAGTVYCIFQPAEENEGGGRVMVEEGLFQQFPMDEVYGLHNWPGLPLGEAAVHDAAVMAAFDIFTLKFIGKGCHAAMPHGGKDVILAASQLVTQIQGIISRESPALRSAVLSITSIHAGDTFNVMPEAIELRGTMRCFNGELHEQLRQRFKAAVNSVADFHGLQFELDYQPRYPATINTVDQALNAVEALNSVPGITKVHRNLDPSMASEDFSFMLQQRPGAYIWLGNGKESAPLHSPFYDFNDELLPLGVQYWVSLANSLLAGK